MLNRLLVLLLALDGRVALALGQGGIGGRAVERAGILLGDEALIDPLLKFGRKAFAEDAVELGHNRPKLLAGGVRVRTPNMAAI